MVAVPFILDSVKREKAGLPKGECVNVYAESSPTGPTSPVTLLPFPGPKTFAASQSEPVRGLYQVDGVLGGLLFEVSNGDVNSVDASGVRTALTGTVSTGTDRVRFAGDTDELIAHSGTTIYRITATDVTPITTYSGAGGALPDIFDVSYLSGWFLYALTNGQFAYSEANDGDNIGALNFATAESHPDGLKAILTLRQSAFLLGTKTIEEWVVTGSSDIPFIPRKGAEQSRGVISRDAAVVADNTIFFVGDDLVFYRLAEVPQRISTSTLEEALAKVPTADLDGIQCTKIEYTGHVFIVVEVPGQGSWAYDAQTQKWIELRTWGKATYQLLSYVYAFGKHLTGRPDGGIFELDIDTLSEPNGDPIERGATAHIPAGMMDSRGNSLHFYGRRGVGNANVPDPQVMMRYSYDGGFTYSHEITRSMGKVGQYVRRARWNRLGRTADLGAIASFRITDACNMRFDIVKVNER